MQTRYLFEILFFLLGVAIFQSELIFFTEWWNNALRLFVELDELTKKLGENEEDTVGNEKIEKKIE